MKKIFSIILAGALILSFPAGSVNANCFDDSEVDLYKDELSSVQVFTAAGNTINITHKDIYLMAQVVYAESRAEPYQGKVAVASVILNRVKDPKFPKSIEAVVTQKGAFSCVRNGKITVNPDEASFKAVLEALKGADPTEKAVFFYNPKIATNTWMKKVSKNNVINIGNHTFFAVR